MEIETAFLHECLQEFFNQFRLKIADTRRFEFGFVYEIRPSRQIDHHARERFIERHVGMPKPHDPEPIALGFLQCLSQNQTDVFHGVMTINLEITFRVDLQIEMTMASKLSEHVIEKRNAGTDLIFTRPVEVQTDADFRFVGLSRPGRFAWTHSLFSSARSSAARNRSFSCGVPIEILRHRSSNGYELTSRTKTPCA